MSDELYAVSDFAGGLRLKTNRGGWLADSLNL